MPPHFVFSFLDRLRLWIYRKDLLVLIDLVSASKDDAILDLGAGTGAIASRMASICDEVYALEPNGQKVEYIKKQYPAVKAFSATAESIPFPESYFNKVYAVNSFHHFQDQQTALDEISRIMKHGGLFVIQEHIPNKIGTKAEKKFLRDKVKFLSLEELQEKIRLHGFRISKTLTGHSGYFVIARRDSELVR